MCTIVVKVVRVYHYSEEEILDNFPNINNDKQSLHNAALKLAQHDFKHELESGEITSSTDDFLFTIKEKQK